ncbi:MAG: uroporphyrinogen-III C-methyltransferase [Clostridia bacterium]|nr:uroporphyrinogen-III C-methyltransferase [Clostridia bacterium]
MSGIVYLVGAGVGDPELMTLKAKRLLSEADVLIYDQLANRAMLNDVPADCEKIFVGKMSNNHTLTQDEINALIVEKAQTHQHVVRLKGGDPYVFGRGGEEGEVLREAGITFEVVPGITSAIGGLAYAGIPITHRDDASDFHVYTGHFKDDERSFDFETISRLTGTLVFLMGVKNIDKIMNGLIDHGKNPKTPVAIIRKASYPDQETWTGTLEELENMKNQYKIKPPCLIVVGDVVNRREDLNFFEEKPLFGKKVVVTRSRAQNSRLVEEIVKLGGDAIEVPAIKIHALEDTGLSEHIHKVGDYQYIVFTSENGVDVFFDCVEKLGYDGRHFHGVKFVTIGSGTANALRKYGIQADIVPERYVGEAVVEAMKPHLHSGDRILIPRSKEARPYLVKALSELAEVTEIQTYETKIDEDTEIERLKDVLADSKEVLLTFTSSSTVHNFLAVCQANGIDQGALAKTSIFSIGPITSQTLADNGLQVTGEAEEYTIDGLLSRIKTTL